MSGLWEKMAEVRGRLIAELRADNERLRGELERADEAADALEDDLDSARRKVGELAAELYAAEKTIALQARILAIRESYESGEIISLQDRRAQELREERDNCRAALERLVKCAKGPAAVFYVPFKAALIEAEKLLYPEEFEYQGGDE